MKLEELEQKSVSTVNSNQITISNEAIPHIINILSKGLYSNPVVSSLREAISNAYDANVEANKSDSPIILNLKYSTPYYEDIYLEITDFGNGISPERFKDIYLNMGISTKRADNQQIGGFGLGRVSMLAVSNINFVITRPGDGMEYIYHMYSDNGSFNIDLCNVVKTNLPTGTTIRIYHNYNKGHGLLDLIFGNFIGFPNIVLNVDSSCRNYRVDNPFYYQLKRTNSYYNVNVSNKINYDYTKLTFAKHFAYFNTDTTLLPFYSHDKYDKFIMIGTVFYKAQILYGPSTLYDERTECKKMSCIIPRFEIGELDLTPNREEVIINDKARKAFDRKAIEIAREINPSISDYDFTKELERYYTIDCKYNNAHLYGVYSYDPNGSYYKIYAYDNDNRVKLDTVHIINECFMNNRPIVIYGKTLNDEKVKYIRNVYGDNCIITTSHYVRSCRINTADKVISHTDRVRYLYKKGLIKIVKSIPEIDDLKKTNVSILSKNEYRAIRIYDCSVANCSITPSICEDNIVVLIPKDITGDEYIIYKTIAEEFSRMCRYIPEFTKEIQFYRVANKTITDLKKHGALHIDDFLSLNNKYIQSFLLLATKPTLVYNMLSINTINDIDCLFEHNDYVKLLCKMATYVPYTIYRDVDSRNFIKNKYHKHNSFKFMLDDLRNILYNSMLFYKVHDNKLIKFYYKKRYGGNKR